MSEVATSTLDLSALLLFPILVGVITLFIEYAIIPVIKQLFVNTGRLEKVLSSIVPIIVNRTLLFILFIIVLLLLYALLTSALFPLVSRTHLPAIQIDFNIALVASIYISFIACYASKTYLSETAYSHMIALVPSIVFILWTYVFVEDLKLVMLLIIETWVVAAYLPMASNLGVDEMKLLFLSTVLLIPTNVLLMIILGSPLPINLWFLSFLFLIPMYAFGYALTLIIAWLHDSY